MSVGSEEKVVLLEKRRGADVSPLTASAQDSFSLYRQAVDYWTDAFQRSVLFVDVLMQRSNAHLARDKDESPNVLHFDYEMLLDGRKFVRPVNYHLVRILPPEGVAVDPKKRPFIVFDPRAGHGPGIGGMKQDSEIGSTLRAGHPCYFVGFWPEPVPGQTVEHVCEAEAIFIEHVIALHPEAEKPCLIGNCQAGWQIAMVGAMFPELVGVLILAAAPLSFWNGVKGKTFSRYCGGLLGGSWTVALASDLGNGKFDGATLVDGFEKLNPADTLWKKAYNLYAKIDSEAPRFLKFEKWWGAPVLLERQEIQFIVDALFMGNRLGAARLRTADGARIDLRNVTSPILIFCSQGDDIAPPPQALGWITDLYRADDEIIAAGQTIIYCMHETVGHLGIFVATAVAGKEHDKFIKNIDLIETLPPGLYEAVFYEKTEGTRYAGLATGDYVLRFESRKLDDIRAIGCNDSTDDRRFLTAKRLSENISGLYEACLSPWLRALSTEQSAAWMRQIHPIRLRYGMFSDRNPFLAGIGNLAGNVKANRKPASPDNFFWKLQESASDAVVFALDSFCEARNFLAEKIFDEVYGATFLQAALGLQKSDIYSGYAGRNPERARDIRRRIDGILDLADEGGLPEALARALLYVVRGGCGFDEREFKMLKQLCDASALLPKMSQSEFRTLIRRQHEILALDEKAAMEALSVLLDKTTEAAAQESLSAVHQVIKAHGEFTAEERRRLQKLETYFVPSHSTPERRKADVENFGKPVCASVSTS